MAPSGFGRSQRECVCLGGFWCGGCTLRGFGKTPVGKGGSCCAGLGVSAGSLMLEADLSLNLVPACCCTCAAHHGQGDIPGDTMWVPMCIQAPWHCWRRGQKVVLLKRGLGRCSPRWIIPRGWLMLLEKESEFT